MKSENIKSAYKNLDKYTYNTEALKEINKLSSEGLEITLPSESIYDTFVNFFDYRKAILDRKADILYKYYSDSKLISDLSLDHLNNSLLINLSRYIGITGLLGLTAYTSIFSKAPFLKLPGLLIGVLGIHVSTRYVSNNILEKKLDIPWKIHMNRLSKGLSGTNYKSNNHDEYFKISDAMDLSKRNPDYLYQNDEKPQEISIYYKIPKPHLTHPFNFEGNDKYFLLSPYEKYPNEEKFFFDPSHPTRSKTNQVLLAEIEGETIKEQSFQEKWRKVLQTTNIGRHIHTRQTTHELSTFDASTANEVGENGYINKRNGYYFPLNFTEGSEKNPVYFKIINNLVDFDKETKEKLMFDVERNKELDVLLRKVHYLQQNSAGDDEISEVISSFNSLMTKKVDEYNFSKVNIVNSINDNEEGKEKLLVHSTFEEEHLKKYFNFLKKNEVSLLKKSDSEEKSFDFEVNPEKYSPWDEYRLVYGDLLTKGRAYFIIKSIPEWKFLQIRKPTPKVLDRLVDRRLGEHIRDIQDSVFEIAALERYHLERKTKVNRFHQEKQSHRI